MHNNGHLFGYGFRGYLQPVARLLLCLFIAIGAQAKSPTLVIGYVDMKPYSYTENGKAAGIYADLMHRLMARLSYSYEMKEYPVKRLNHLLGTGDAHIWIRVDGDRELQSQTYKSNHIVGTLKLGLHSVQKVDYQNIWQVHEPVIAIAGYSYTGLRQKLEQADAGIEFIEASSHQSAFRMLRSGRARLLLDYERPAGYAVEQIGLKKTWFTQVSDAPSYFYVSKKAPDAELLLEQLEKAYQSLIMEKWQH